MMSNSDARKRASAPEPTADIETLLAEHRLSIGGDGLHYDCTCGETVARYLVIPEPGSPAWRRINEAHRAHLAAVLAAYVREQEFWAWADGWSAGQDDYRRLHAINHWSYIGSRDYRDTPNPYRQETDRG